MNAKITGNITVLLSDRVLKVAKVVKLLKVAKSNSKSNLRKTTAVYPSLQRESLIFSDISPTQIQGTQISQSQTQIRSRRGTQIAQSTQSDHNKE